MTYEKIGVTIGTLVIGLTLTACGAINHSNQRSKNASWKAENSSFKSQIYRGHRSNKEHLTDEEYALVAERK